MKHYNEDGTPTAEHERLCDRAIDLAEKIISGGYVSKMEFVRQDKGVRFKVSLLGKMAKKNGKVTSRVIPSKADLDSELVEYAMDEIEFMLVRRNFPDWKKTTITERCVYANDTVLIWDFVAYNR